MPAIPRNLVHVFVSVFVVSATLLAAATPGILEGHLKIISLKEVELADATPSQNDGEQLYRLSTGRIEP
jgi:hypothetical protein